MLFNRRCGVRNFLVRSFGTEVTCRFIRSSMLHGCLTSGDVFVDSGRTVLPASNHGEETQLGKIRPRFFITGRYLWSRSEQHSLAFPFV